jgi:hypothetical protein
MAIEKKEVEFAKEIADVGEALYGLLADIKEKKPIAAIAVENLPALMSAVEGVDQLDDEIKASPEAAFSTMGSYLGKVIAALLKKKEEAAPAPAE